MEFSTYVENDNQEKINRIKDELLGLLESSTEFDNEIKEQLRAALMSSGGSSFGSRYGLDAAQIRFADSELIQAYERNEDSIKYLKYRFDFKYYPLNHKLREFPLVVAVEASSKCNLRCKMCFQSSMDKMEQPANRGIMSWDTYRKFLDEIEKNQLYSIVFASRGEPLLNPRIDEMIKEAKNRGVLDIKMNTNATLLTEDMSRRLLKSGLDLLVFSVDSVDIETYNDIRGTNLELVQNNIKRFIEIRKNEFPDSKMKIRVAMVITKDVEYKREEEIAKAKAYWNGLVDELSCKTENNFISIYEDIDDLDRNVCNLLWERVYLWHDGSVNPCDIDYMSSMELGNINDSSIQDIWNGDRMNRLREEHLNNRDRICTVCKNCVGY